MFWATEPWFRKTRSTQDWGIWEQQVPRVSGPLGQVHVHRYQVESQTMASGQTAIAHGDVDDGLHGRIVCALVDHATPRAKAGLEPDRIAKL